MSADLSDAERGVLREAARGWHVRATRAEERERLLREALEKIASPKTGNTLTARKARIVARDALAASPGRPEGEQ